MVDELIPTLNELIVNEVIPLLIVPTTISHLNVQPIVNALDITKNLIFIEEGSKHNGLSGAIIGKLSELKIEFNLL